PRSDITLTSTTGYYHLVTDGLLVTPPASGAGPALGADNHFTRHDVTEELRANSDFAGPLNFTAGGFFQDASVKNIIGLEGNTFIGPPPLLAAGSHEMSIRSYSVFGQARWKVITPLEIALGARWTHEKRHETPYDLLTGVPVLTPIPINEISSD